MFYTTEEKDGKLVAEPVEFDEGPQNPLHEEIVVKGETHVVMHLNFLKWMRREFERLSITHVTEEFGHFISKYLTLSQEEIDSFPPISQFSDHVLTEPHKTEKVVKAIPFLELLEKICKERN